MYLRMIIAFLPMLPLDTELPGDPASASNEVLGINVITNDTGWVIGFGSDGGVSAQYGSLPSDNASLPEGTVQFDALLKAVGRLKLATRGSCNTQVAVRKKGEIRTTAFYISDDTLFRYLMDSFENRWKPQLPNKRFHDLVKLYPFFPSPDGWDGRIAQWGSMREVLVEGKRQARISLNLALRPDQIGVGALEGLEGEITIYNGRAWIAKGEPASVEATDQQATLLTTARVATWSSFPLEAEIPPTDFDSAIARIATRTSIDVNKPFPFVIEGKLTVIAHVVQESCPQGESQSGHDTVKRESFTIRDEPALLVGFYAEHGEGSLTHHGSKTHVHVLIPGNPPRTGHVDSVTVAPGAVIRLPASASTATPGSQAAPANQSR